MGQGQGGLICTGHPDAEVPVCISIGKTLNKSMCNEHNIEHVEEDPEAMVSSSVPSTSPSSRIERPDLNNDQIVKAVHVLKGPNGSQAHELALGKLAVAAHSRNGAKALAEAGGIRAILCAMKHSGLTEDSQLASCNALLGLCLEARICNEVVSKGGVDVTLQFLRTHLNSETVVAAACKVLQKLALATKPRGKICSQGGIVLVERVMRRHLGSAEVQENGCFVLCNLALDSKTTAQDHQTNVKAVISSMQWHPQNLSVLGAAVCTLYNLMCKGDFASEAIRLGGQDALKQAMSKHSSLGRMREAQAVAAAWEDCGSPKVGHEGDVGGSQDHSPMGKEKWTQSGYARNGQLLPMPASPNSSRTTSTSTSRLSLFRGMRDNVSKAAAALQNPRTSAKDFMSACGELSKSSATTSGKWRILESGAVPALVRGMTRSDVTIEMVLSACTALWDFCNNEEGQPSMGESFSIEVASKGGVEAVLRALSIHRTSVHVAEAGCKVLQQLALSGHPRTKISSQGGLTVIEETMSQHFTSACVQESGCSAICNLALEPGVHLYRKNVGTVIATMKGHRENADVQEAAVCALYNLICTGNLLDAVIEMGGGTVVASAMSAHARIAAMEEARAIAEAAHEDSLGLGLPLWGPTPSTYSSRHLM